MAHRLSTEDREFRAQFESGVFPLTEFNHRAHLSLAYGYLAEHDTETAHQLMREAFRMLGVISEPIEKWKKGPLNCLKC
jgi:hypothetical protein